MIRREHGIRFGAGFALLLALLLLPASGNAAPPVSVFAAASLKESMDAAAAQYHRETGRPVQVSYAASSALARQIEQRAPADVFISADQAWMDWLQARDLIAPATGRDLLGNTLVLVAPAASDAQPVALQARPDLRPLLGAQGRLSLAMTDSVPAGTYAKAAFEALGQWPALAPRVAESDSVRAALALVARGEAPLGVVYASDAQAEPRVKVLATFPPDSHPPIVYPVARLRASRRPQQADAFVQWLEGDAAAAIFHRHGLTPLASASPVQAAADPQPPARGRRAGDSTAEVGVWGFRADELAAIRLSLKVAVAAALGSLPAGIAVAWLLARRRFPGKALLDALVHLPLVLPPVVVGYALLVLLGNNGAVGAWLASTFGITFAFRWTGAALASAIMGFPLLVRTVRLSIEHVDRRLEDAAATLGASPLRVFFTVTLPLAWPGLVAGAVLAFAKALGEFGATITFVSSIPGETRTVSSAIYGLMQVPGGEAGIWRLAAVAVAISFAALLASEWLVRRQRGEERMP